MQQITYASKSLITTDALTDALIELVTAIDRGEHSEAVTVPAFDDNGNLVEARMTLDASSEVVAVPVDVDVQDQEATTDAVNAAVLDIRARIRTNTRITAAQPIIDDEPRPYDYDEY